MGEDQINGDVQQAEDITPAPETPTGNEISNETTEITQPTEKTPYNEIPRFKELVQEKNQYKTELETMKKELETLKQPKAQQTTGIQSNLREYDQFFDQTEHGFKGLEEYQTFPELYQDIRNAIYSDLIKVQEKFVEQTESQKEEENNKLKADLDEIDKYFGEDKAKKEKFYDILENKFKNKEKPDVMALLTIFEEFYQKTDNSVEDKKTETARKIAQSAGGSEVTLSPGYDPKRDRGKSIRDIAQEAAQNNI